MEVTDPNADSIACRVLAALWAATATVGLGAATASAHGGVGDDGDPVALPVVLGLPVVAGLLAGGLATRSGDRLSTAGRRRASLAFGVLLVALGGTFASAALTSAPLLGVLGGSAGALATLRIAGREGSHRRGRRHHADVTLGGICAHRVLEGVALGALWTGGATVGAAGAVVVAGHAAVETAVVGGVYPSNWLGPLGAVVLVQVCYVAGALAGLGVGEAAPPPVHAASLGLLAGILLIVGVAETRHSRRGVTAA